MKLSPMRSELSFDAQRMSYYARRPAQLTPNRSDYERKIGNANSNKATMVRANIKRRILSRSVFHGEQENAIVSEMMSGGAILKIKDTVNKFLTRSANFVNKLL